MPTYATGPAGGNPWPRARCHAVERVGEGLFCMIAKFESAVDWGDLCAIDPRFLLAEPACPLREVEFNDLESRQARWVVPRLV